MSKTFTVTFLPQKKKTEVPEGTTILAAEQMAGLEPDAPCGGNGKCGKCRVEILEGKKTGVVLACQTPVDSDMKIDTMLQEKVQRILAEGKTRSVPVDPGIALTDPDSGRPYYLMAFDIGTTTVVGYLLDGKDGHEAGVASMMNPQHQFGADVISRANYVLENGGEQMRKVIVDALNQLIGKVCADAGILREDIIQISIVGNTCMHHLFLGISPDSLVHAPYVPAVKEGMIITPEKAGLKMNPSGRVLILPNIAGFVGADTVGCMLSVAFDQLDKLTLMLDIGTNGELVMGNKKKMVTTSTAAGPAFEGAKIECGMRGSRGAVSHLKTEDGRLSLEVVDHAKPIGICGSGLIDILAFLIRYGFIDSYGGFCDVDELEDPLAKAESWRLQEIDGKPAFVLFPAEETGNGSPVYISQKDIREVQLAKGAIAAGIQIMTEKLDIRPEDIQQVFLAGAFGNYMDAGNACEIGLIPYELRNRIIPIGNAAGEGAKLACLNQGEYRYACKMAEGAEFIELATESEFQDVFVDKLEFSRAVER